MAESLECLGKEAGLYPSGAVQPWKDLKSWHWALPRSQGDTGRDDKDRHRPNSATMMRDIAEFREDRSSRGSPGVFLEERERGPRAGRGGELGRGRSSKGRGCGAGGGQTDASQEEHAGGPRGQGCGAVQPVVASSYCEHRPGSQAGSSDPRPRTWGLGFLARRGGAGTVRISKPPAGGARERRGRSPSPRRRGDSGSRRASCRSAGVSGAGPPGSPAGGRAVWGRRR